MPFDLNRILELAGLKPLAESAAEPEWITRLFNLPDGAREDIDVDGAELSVAMLGLNLPDDERPVGLRGLETPAHLRGRGIGSKVYRELVKGADAYGRPLELDAYPYEARKTNADGKATPEQVKALVDYLGGFGFRPLASDPNYNRPVAMVYRPRKPE